MSSPNTEDAKVTSDVVTDSSSETSALPNGAAEGGRNFEVSPKKHHRYASHHINVHTPNRRPRAVVLLFGWSAAPKSVLSSYASLYESRGCSTVVATAPTYALLAQDSVNIGEVAVTAAREAARLIRMGEMSEAGYGRVPVLVHSFGGGGALLLEELERRMTEDLGDIVSTASSKGTAMRGPCTDWRRMPSFRTSSRSLDVGTVDCDSDSDAEDNTDLSNKKLSFSGTKEKEAPPPMHGSLATTRVTVSPKTQSSAKRRRKRGTPPKVKRTDSQSAPQDRTGLPAKRQTYNAEERAFVHDFSLVASRLQGGFILFDSGPCYLTLSSIWKEATDCGISNALVRLLGQGVWCTNYTLGMSFDVCRSCGLLASEPDRGRPGRFWSRMEQSILCPRHGYVYSTTDRICNAATLERLIGTLKERGKEVSLLKLEGSGHLKHWEGRTEEYERMIDQMLLEIAPRVAEVEDQEDWWSSDEEDEGQGKVDDAANSGGVEEQVVPIGPCHHPSPS